jgi:hypothetical protein
MSDTIVGRYGLRVVGHGIVRTVSPLSGNRRRRLLEFTAEDHTEWHWDSILAGIESFDAWNHTSKPCSALAQAFVEGYGQRISSNGSSIIPGMGVIDIDTLEQCIHWRKVY